VILSPGPTYNTLGTVGGQQVIMIGGKQTRPTSGHLNMTTVSISNDSITAFQALAAWLAGDQTVVPRTAIYPPGVSVKQQEQQDTEDFQSSEDSATIAALCQLGYPKGFGVVTVQNDGPAHGILQPGDRMVSVDGRPAGSTATLQKIVQSLSPGQTVPVVVERQGKQTTLQVKLGPPPKDGKGARLGITVSDTCLAPFTVDIQLANVGGPSAGLMFALGIIDKLGSQDLTHGRFIAGTGEIDPQRPEQGIVSPIGGIQLKMIAARRKGASIFLAPAGNCSDVKGAVPSGLKVVKVSTLRGAVQDLVRIQHGQSVPGC
jgi:PDZ domain-containing protein